MTNMLIRPTAEELKTFDKPDYVIYNAGAFPCNRHTEGVSSSTSVAISFARKEMVILGTEYAGEMKKGVLTIVMYLMMKMGALPLHSSCNEGKDGTTTLFFGLSGTGKTTLSADPARMLIGDDEHVWTDSGVFNVEGGCYAKCINLSAEKEPEIYNAIRFGAIVENVVYDGARKVDYNDVSITENTRCAYPLEFIPNAKLPALGTHPTNVILLTCDAFGVLPPVSRLTKSQAMYHFISGYTAKVAGTEMGVTEPTAAFSACYGSPFLVLHPVKYAKKLAEMLETHSAPAWLLNTGWTGGPYGVGSRIKLKYTRAMIDAIHDGSLAKQEYEEMPVFGLQFPKKCANVPDEVLNPRSGWPTTTKFEEAVNKLAQRFFKNFEQYEGQLTDDVLQGGPKKSS
jgi:phosphoenolpyruvate carboxykinase (ATP)